MKCPRNIEAMELPKREGMELPKVEAMRPCSSEQYKTSHT